NALQALLPQIRAEIREEFCTGSGPSGSGGNPPLRIRSLTWRRSLMSWLVRMYSRLDCLCTSLRVMHLLSGRPISKPKERLKREYHFIRQTDTETSTEFMQRFLRLVGFLEAAAGTAEEQAKNFQWGLRKDDDGNERPDKRQKSGDRHQPTTQQSSHRNHGHNNDRHGPDRQGGGDNHHSNNNYSGNNNRSSDNGRDQRNRGQQSNRPVNSDFQQSKGPSEGYSYPVCTTCGRRHPGECRRAVGTFFKCGQTGHLQKNCKKNTAASTSGQAEKKPGASGRVFAITEDHATKTS
nr:hypothetical protein [Tanacetum cinerariifolium]